jgi:hypothetical protein
MVRFDISYDDRELIAKIVDRTLDIIADGAGHALTKRDRADRRINLIMDLTACHANGTPLRLADLLAADDFNVAHDVGGISRHIDHDTGRLTGCFLPRFAAKQAA